MFMGAMCSLGAVPPEGIEAGRPGAQRSERRNQKPSTDEASFTITQDSASSVSEIAPDDAPSFGVLPRAAAAGEIDPVDVALARALVDASTAGRFDVVLQLAKELEARRLERRASEE
jgi:hypothetical protein